MWRNGRVSKPGLFVFAERVPPPPFPPTQASAAMLQQLFRHDYYVCSVVTGALDKGPAEPGIKRLLAGGVQVKPDHTERARLLHDSANQGSANPLSPALRRDKDTRKPRRQLHARVHVVRNQHRRTQKR